MEGAAKLVCSVKDVNHHVLNEEAGVPTDVAGSGPGAGLSECISPTEGGWETQSRWEPLSLTR